MLHNIGVFLFFLDEWNTFILVFKCFMFILIFLSHIMLIYFKWWECLKKKEFEMKGVPLYLSLFKLIFCCSHFMLKYLFHLQKKKNIMRVQIFSLHFFVCDRLWSYGLLYIPICFVTDFILLHWCERHNDCMFFNFFVSLNFLKKMWLVSSFKAV